MTLLDNLENRLAHSDRNGPGGAASGEGAALGVLMLDTRFPRIVGDIGNPATFDFPTVYRVVRGAVQRNVMAGDRALLGPFIEAARQLERAGVFAITTSCGFLALFQREMASAVNVPVFTSSLLQVVPAWKSTGSRGRVGVMTAHAGLLTYEHLRCCGWTPDVPVAIAGMEGQPAFSGAILKNAPELDVEEVRREVRGVAAGMVRDYPDLRALVLECTNLPPYGDDVRAATGLPVFDIVTLAKEFHVRWVQSR